MAAAVIEGKRFSARGVLTLQGPQGRGKTSWIGKLVNEPTLRDEVIKRDHHMDGGNKDSILSAMRHWIVEIGELDGAFRKDIARLKGVLTNDCDKIRPPYGKVEIEMPRRTVFAAIVNDLAFLVDPTGNSRFWTIAVEGLDYNHDINMQQLFAQLRLAVDRGEPWWLTLAEDAALAHYNQRHRAVNAIAEKVKDNIDHEVIGSEIGTYRSASEVLMELGLSNPTNAQCKDCGSVLREIYGQPKRYQGRDRWRVHLKGEFKPIAVKSPALPAIHPEDEF